ncbi:MAG TPA: TraR/DksA C4-type zinc finger protein [Sedimentisphaerales bacterium]|nr:TraR/DksA C4-type zinc finger protein [Sedimentisphaerales bacterium]
MAEKRKKTSKKDVAQEQITKSPLSAKEIAAFKTLLLQRRREIHRNVHEIEGETLRKSRLDASGDLSSMPIHMADLGTDNFQQEFSLGLMDSERQIITEIDDALHRIEAGTYGICEGTGKPIAKARLDAQPWARYSVEYARLMERGHIRETE